MGKMALSECLIVSKIERPWRLKASRNFRSGRVAIGKGLGQPPEAVTDRLDHADSLAPQGHDIASLLFGQTLRTVKSAKGSFERLSITSTLCVTESPAAANASDKRSLSAATQQARSKEAIRPNSFFAFA